MIRRIFQICDNFLENEKIGENEVLTVTVWEIEFGDFLRFCGWFGVSDPSIHLYNFPKFILPIPYFHSENLATFSVSMYTYTSKLKNWLKIHLFFAYFNEFFVYRNVGVFIKTIPIY